MTSEEDQVGHPRAISDAAFYAAAQTGMFPPPRTSLFRYVSIRNTASWELVELTLLENRLRLNTATSFNDPFDSDPCYVNDVPYEELLRRATIEDAWGNVINSGVRTLIMGAKGTLNLQDAEKIIRVIVEQQIKAENKKQYITSFCRRISAQLLWAHYADSYRGLAYHFVSRGSTASPISDVQPVRYERQRPIILLSEILDRFDPPPAIEIFHQHLSFIRRAYLTKSIEWAYEEEERLLSEEPEVLFDPRELAAIIVGPRFSSENLSKLKQLVSKRSRPLSIYRAKVSESDYAIEVEWSKGAI